MEDLEREYLKENMRRMEQWENTPSAPSGRSSGLTEVEKEKLIDLLFAKLEHDRTLLAGLENEIKRMGDELQRANEASTRWEERTIAAEKRAEAAEKKAVSERTGLQEKINRLLALVEKLQNCEELKAMVARAEKAEKMVADLIAESKTMRGRAYGSKSQRRRKNDDGGNNGDPRDAQSEKDSMGGKDTVKALPESDENGEGQSDRM